MLFTTTKKQLRIITILGSLASTYWAFTLPLDQVVIGTSLLFLALVGITEAYNGN